MKLTPNRRMDAVGPDQYVSFVQLAAARLTIMESGNDAARNLLKFRKPKTTAKILAADALAYGPQEKLLQMPAMDRVLRPLVTRGQPSLFAGNQLAELVKEDELPCRDAGPCEIAAKAKLGQFAHGRRQQIDADAQRSRFSNSFIDTDRDASLVKAERHG
jgi:hypothetical protein